MPVEIREIVIKTEITAPGRHDPHGMKTKDLHLLKKQLLNECRRLITELTKRKDHKR